MFAMVFPSVPFCAESATTTVKDPAAYPPIVAGNENVRNPLAADPLHFRYDNIMACCCAGSFDMMSSPKNKPIPLSSSSDK